MTTLYADSRRLKLDTGNELEAFVRSGPNGSQRQRCLLLHGNPGSLLDWAQLVPRLASAVDIAAIDLPGFGRSPRTDPSPESLSLERLADQVILAADAFQLVPGAGHMLIDSRAPELAELIADALAGAESPPA